MSDDTSDTPRLPIQLCAKCKQYLPQGDFPPSVRGKRGYYCTACRKVANSKRDRRKLTLAMKGVERLYDEFGAGKSKTYADFLAKRAESEPDAPSEAVWAVGWHGEPCEHLISPYSVSQKQLDLTASAVRHYESKGRKEGTPLAREDLAVMLDHTCSVSTCGITFRTVALVDEGEITRVDRIELDKDGVNFGIYRLEIVDFNERRIYAAPEPQ